MINVSIHNEMRECHRGAQEGQAMFYWFQAVFYLQENQDKGGRQTRGAHIQINIFTLCMVTMVLWHNLVSVRNTSSVTGGLGSTRAAQSSNTMLLINFYNLNPHLSD